MSRTKVDCVTAADNLPNSEYSRSFGAEAARYARYRPSYPDEAIRHVLNGLTTQRILDLGAGTGKLTASLIGRAPEVIAVEPDDAMRAVLAVNVPAAKALAGSAEDIPLPDGSVDAILVGQAFHWFPRPESDYEMARVLRPGGVVGLVWNFPDRDVEWVPKLYRATRDESPPGAEPGAPLDAELFTTTEETSFRSAHVLHGPDGLINLVHTWSWVITRPANEQATIDERLHALITEYPELQGETVTVPQQTKVLRSYRR
jgi:SAM-dependent methyltransferase